MARNIRGRNSWHHREEAILGRAPDKGEVGDSSPPRPTIQITSKHAAIHTFPVYAHSSSKAALPKICQIFGYAKENT
jgi:hypothetical protein